MGYLEGRVAIITGAARGLGREHARLFAREGAKVIVNDLADGSANQAGEQTVADIVSDGGIAVFDGENVADWDGARRLVEHAVSEFGRLDVLVNNAGILRDRMLANMVPEEWDEVINVHLRGHFAPTHHAARHWRERCKSGEQLNAAIVHTTSTSGLFASPGQSNYAAAKSGIATFSQVCAKELARYGVRSNAVAPAARTRLTASLQVMQEAVAGDGFDEWDPANVSPVLAYLCGESCDITGETFFVQGRRVERIQSWTSSGAIEADARWTIEGLGAIASLLA